MDGASASARDCLLTRGTRVTGITGTGWGPCHCEARHRCTLFTGGARLALLRTSRDSGSGLGAAQEDGLKAVPPRAVTTREFGGQGCSMRPRTAAQHHVVLSGQGTLVYHHARRLRWVIAGGIRGPLKRFVARLRGLGMGESSSEMGRCGEGGGLAPIPPCHHDGLGCRPCTIVLCMDRVLCSCVDWMRNGQRVLGAGRRAIRRRLAG